MTTASGPQKRASLDNEREVLALARRIEEEIRLFDSTDLLNGMNFIALTAGFSEEAHAGAPDGFGQKFRYIRNLVAKKPLHLGFPGDPDDKGVLFGLIDRLFASISESWMRTANHLAKQRPKQQASIGAWFMSRVRDLHELPLGGTLQHRQLVLDRFTPFDPIVTRVFGWTTAQCVKQLDTINGACAGGIGDFGALRDETRGDVAGLHERMVRGEITLAQAVASGRESVSATKMRAAWQGLFAVTARQIGELAGLPVDGVAAFLARAAVQPGSFDSEYVLPTDEPYRGMFFRRDDGSFYVVDFCSLYQDFFALAESVVTGEGHKTAMKYYEARGKVMERTVAGSLARLFGGESVFQNLYYSPAGRGDAEADILVRHGDVVLLCEVKGRELNREISGAVGPDRMAEDFKTIQKGYDQCARTCAYIKAHDPARFYAADRSTLCLELSGPVREFHYLVVTANSFGFLAGNCSELLRRGPEDPLPVVMSEFELSTMLGLINTPDSLLEYLRQRVLLHGFLKTGDELEPAGVFVTQGSLDELIEKKMSGEHDYLFLSADVSFVFNGPEWEREPRTQEAIEDKRLTMTPVTHENVRAVLEGDGATGRSRRVRRGRK